MIEIKEMSAVEIDGVLRDSGYGHLACSQDDRPYIVPVHYAYDKPDIYIYTTEGKKWEMIHANPHVCLQVEKVTDNADWQSVIIYGEAQQIVDRVERENAVSMIVATNPTLTPAISIRWNNDWIRENREVVFRISPTSITGRSTIKVNIRSAGAQFRK
jgi:nitroimidazol reductase NimA-like FMN-containing flavoprotein (pyridoxamine 5'-phosphate oxidase superfamily)